MSVRLLEDAIALLLREMPFHGYVLVQVHKRVDRRIRYVGTRLSRGSIELLFNPENFLRLSIDERMAALEHEVMHLILLHPLRRGGRKGSIWNVASDVAANQFVTRIPPGSFVVDDFGLERGLVAERYYDLLAGSEEPLHEVYRRGCSNGRGGGKLSGPGSTQGQEAGRTSGDDSPEGEVRHFAGDEAALHLEELHPYWGEDSNLADGLLEAVVREVVRDAVRKARGALPGNIVEIVESLIRGRTNWRAAMRSFVMRARRVSREASWTRPNRRYPDQPGFQRKARLRVCVAVDTSGSVGERELALFASEVERIARYGDEVFVVECDAAIQRVYEFDRLMPPRRDFVGRRGTDFRPVFDWAKSQRPGFDCIIYLTDGYGEAPERSCIPTLWALTEGGRAPVGWGLKVVLREA